MTETKMQLVDWLDDLCVRFIINLPEEELSSAERICFQIEEAQWFYEDFIRPTDPNLPSLNLRNFCSLIFRHCPALSEFSDFHHEAAFNEFLAYKTRVPVRGAIMLNKAVDSVVLVKGWKKSANWSFPRGKINKDEKDLECAIREVYEETGFDIRAAGLAPIEEDAHSIEMTMREQNMRLYVFRDVPMDTHFEPRTRKEISKVQWYKLSELPTQKKKNHGQGEDLAMNANKFYMVAPFLGPLRKWIAQQKKGQRKSPLAVSQIVKEIVPSAPQEPLTFEQQTGKPVHDNHIARLVAQLHSSQQSRAIASVPQAEPTLTDEQAGAASIRLKRLLQVPQKSAQVGVGAPLGASTIAEEQETPAQRANVPSNMRLPMMPDSSHASGFRMSNGQTPQTPFDQVVHTPMNPPESPKRAERHALQARHGLPSRAPAFPSPHEVSQHHHSITFPFPLHQPSNLHQGARLPNQTFNQINRVNPAAIARQRPVPVNNAPELSAPYQRTGDPQSARSRQALTTEKPLIPPAHKLPTPKLTSHLSTLLSLFKSPDELKSPTSSLPAEVPSVGREIAQPLGPMSPKELDAPTEFVGHRTTMLDPRRDSAMSVLSPSLDVPRRTSLATPRSNQQEALLNLFRRPSEPQTQPSSTPQAELQKLAPPMAPVELSANPSPSHSRNTSEMDQQPTKPSLSNMNGRITIQKRPESSASLRQPPVSATVTRPLDLPQFDRIARRESSASPTPKKPSPAHEQRAAPVTILARPSSSHKPNGSPKQKPQIVIKAESPLRVKPHKKRDSLKSSPKPFQPQILQRKPQEPFSISISQPPPITIPPKHESPTSMQPSPFDTAHRGSLLSILSKPSAAQSPISPLAGSPLTEKPTTRDDLAELIMDDGQRSRVGSINSAIESGNRLKNASGRQTPKSAGVDKLALLSFLDEVAKEAQR